VGAREGQVQVGNAKQMHCNLSLVGEMSDKLDYNEYRVSSWMVRLHWHPAVRHGNDRMLFALAAHQPHWIKTMSCVSSIKRSTCSPAKHCQLRECGHCAFRPQVQYLYYAFCRLRPGLPVMALHGKQQQMKRIEVYQEFCQRPNAVLFATDIAARGLG